MNSRKKAKTGIGITAGKCSELASAALDKHEYENGVGRRNDEERNRLLDQAAAFNSLIFASNAAASTGLLKNAVAP